MECNLLHLIVSTPLLRPHEYLDPGSGSVIIQVIIAGLVGIGFVVRTYWTKIKGFFTRNKSERDNDSNVGIDNDGND